MRYWLKRILIGFLSVGFVVTLVISWDEHQTIQNLKTANHILPNDDFSTNTMNQLYQITSKMDLQSFDYQPFLPTGGLNSADPSIMAWNSYMDLTLGVPPHNAPMYMIKEMNKKYIAGFGPWKPVNTQTGQVYYVDTKPNHQNFFMFYKGSTAIWVEVFPGGNFPVGLMSHLTPIHK